MADNLTLEQRSYVMAQVKGRGNLSTEGKLMALLRDAGLTGWRRHADLRGRPDFVFRRERVALFVDGCFWHRCPRCFRMPTSNVEYWERKISRNVARDRAVNRDLRLQGWRVLRVWEHALENPQRVVSRLRRELAKVGTATAAESAAPYGG